MRIGTRGSTLALIQAEWVAARLDGAGRDRQDHHSGRPGGRRAGQIALGLRARAGAARRPHRSGRAFGQGRAHRARSRAGAGGRSRRAPTPTTRSAEPRRSRIFPPGRGSGPAACAAQAQIRAVREDVEVVDLRGNVDTRLRKLAEGQVDALVLALAGLQRLGRRGGGGRSPDRACARRRPGRARARSSDRIAERRAARLRSATPRPWPVWPPNALSSTPWAPPATHRSAPTLDRGLTRTSSSSSPGWACPTAPTG